MQTKSISTAYGSTRLRRIGSGPPVIVFHGGPGFGHEYLVEPLRHLAERRQLIFYDQPGCGSTPAPAGGATLKAAIRHASDILEAVADGKPVGVLAHSWGSLVFIGALAERSSAPLRIAEGMLINPTAVDRRNYEIARRNFSRRVPVSARLTILLGAIVRADGAWVMEQLMPYYMGDRSAVSVPAIPLNIATYRSVDASLGDFDFSTALDALKRVTVVRGEADFTTPSEIEALIAATAHLETIPGAGHFPFFENPGAFKKVAMRAFKILS